METEIPASTLQKRLCAAMTAKSSASLQPALMKLYQKNMGAYQQAVTNFIQGYREGAAEKVNFCLQASLAFPCTWMFIQGQRGGSTGHTLPGKSWEILPGLAKFAD